MAESEHSIDCGQHGPACATYICGHLARDPLQRWFCDYPSADEPWPDAWCAGCQRAFEAHGKGNAENEIGLDLTPICHHCYEAQQGAAVASLMEDCAERWAPFLKEAFVDLQRKQDRLIDQFDFSKHERWDWDQESDEIRFSNAGLVAVVAKAPIVGSISTISDTWLWSWANPSHEPRTVDEMLSVRDCGEAKGFANLVYPKWPATECDAWEMTAVAGKILGAEGAYRMPGDSCHFFALLKDVRRVQ